MARGRKLFVVGIMAVCLAGVAMAGDSGDDDDGSTSSYSKKEIKACYKANPGCTGECWDANGDGNIVCAVPEGDDDDSYDLCGGTKKNSNWQVWDSEDADAACTCADGYVTSAKVVSKWGNKDGYPKASKLCTIDCGDDNVTCEDDADQLESGPLSCYCTDGTGDKYAEKEAVKAAKEDVDSFFEELKSELKEAYLYDKEFALADKEDAKAEAKELTSEAKSELSQIKADYKADMDMLMAEWKEAKKAAKKGEWDDDYNGDDDNDDNDDNDDGNRLRNRLRTLRKAAARKAAAKAKPAAPAAPAAPAGPVAPAAKVAAAAEPAKKPVA